MKRGDIVTAVVPGDFGKPRPALVIQSDDFDETDSLTILLFSSFLIDSPHFRLPLEPTVENGLQRSTQIMIDKIMTVRRDRLGKRIGCLQGADITAVNRALALFLGFG